MTTPTFYTGAPDPGWLARSPRPLCVSFGRLRSRTRLPAAVCDWVLDSRGFNEIRQHGRWTIEPAAYAHQVQRYRHDIGRLRWAATQDWVCEPDQVVRTGLTVAEHQQRTVDSYLILRDLAPDVPWLPVVQGWTRGSYRRCVALYAAAGVDLAQLPAVGIGSVCTRPSALSVALIVDELWATGLLNLHGFGVTIKALSLVGGRLISADSQSWSATARYEPDRCPEGRRDCRNCEHWAYEHGDYVQGIWDHAIAAAA